MFVSMRSGPNFSSLLTTANRELAESIQRVPVAWLLAVLSIKHRYERSLLGPFWITFSQAVYIVVIAFVFGTIFKADTKTFVPFVTAGLLIIGWITSTLQESSNILIEKAHKIQDGDRYLLSHISELIFRNFLILLHHLVILISVLIFFRTPLNLFDIILGVFGMVVIAVNLFGLASFISLISLRYRDMGPLVSSVLKILFIVSPVMWEPELLGDRQHLVNFNPIHHWINLVREPLTHSTYRVDSLLISLGTAAVSLFAGYITFVFSHRKISLWL